MASLHLHPRPSLTVLLAVAALSIWACNNEQLPGALSPTEAASVQSLSKRGNGGNDNGGTSTVKPVPRTVSESSECVGFYSKFIQKKEGGALQNCRYSYEIPSRALQQSMEMHISILNDNNYITADFGPSQSFNKPVLIAIPYEQADLTGIEVQNLTIAWFDEATGEWVDIGGLVDPSNKVVWALVNHFTQYTLSVE